MVENEKKKEEKKKEEAKKEEKKKELELTTLKVSKQIELQNKLVGFMNKMTHSHQMEIIMKDEQLSKKDQ